MEVIGRPRTDEMGRRFFYKRCAVCGFALRYFLEPVPAVVAPGTPEAKGRKAPPSRRVSPSLHAARPPEAPPRKPALSPHTRRKAQGSRPHGSGSASRAAARRRR